MFDESGALRKFVNVFVSDDDVRYLQGLDTPVKAGDTVEMADNALLISAIALLREIDAPAWMTPMLKLFFVVSYVALAAFVGAFAERA